MLYFSMLFHRRFQFDVISFDVNPRSHLDSKQSADNKLATAILVKFYSKILVNFYFKIFAKLIRRWKVIKTPCLLKAFSDHTITTESNSRIMN